MDAFGSGELSFVGSNADGWVRAWLPVLACVSRLELTTMAAADKCKCDTSPAI